MVTNSARVTGEERFRSPELSPVMIPRAWMASTAVEELTAPAGTTRDRDRAAASRAEVIGRFIYNTPYLW